MLDLTRTYRLSRYAFIRPADGGFRLQSLLSGWQFKIQSSSIFQLLLALTRPIKAADLIAQVPESQREKVQTFIEQCYAGGLLTEIDKNGLADEDRGSLAHWEFHDLLFHTSSRYGRNTEVIGATYRFRGKLPNEPHLSSLSDEKDFLQLPRPDTQRLQRDDVSLNSALERRRTLYGTKPISIEALGEFLYRTCRVTNITNSEDGDTYLRKVYPSGGSLHPLEIYVVASKCIGLNPGLYHYCPIDHGLAAIKNFDEDAEHLLSNAKQSVGHVVDDIPLLFVISARFRRTAWKYKSIAYQAILKEVGGLYQTMYLVATAMGLKPCALGCGNSDRFARMIGTDYYMETSVGEFILAGGD
ncbi:MAG TPA: SagB family peptide dehydrogenase [Pyrinomonadaceae bacterium]|nr:SagB family peptide dehydrogenase [Pyrinomonadaceae bacterium]